MCKLIHRRRKVLNNWRGARFRIFGGKGDGGASMRQTFSPLWLFGVADFYYFKFQLALECFIVRI